MVRRDTTRYPRVFVGGVIERRDDAGRRRVEAVCPEPRYLPAHGRGEGWVWDQGELICPLSWFREELPDEE